MDVPRRRAISSYQSKSPLYLFAVSSDRKRGHNRLKVPAISGISDRIADPFAEMTLSTVLPMTGLAVMPEKESEAPHSVPTTRAANGQGILCVLLISLNREAMTSFPRSIV